jgi:putative oxidoreductase
VELTNAALVSRWEDLVLSSRLVFVSKNWLFATCPGNVEVDGRTKLVQSESSTVVTGWWAVAIRAIVGYGFIAHGLAKLFKGPEAFAAILQTLGVPAPHLMAWATILTELLGGLAVLLGAFVRMASIPLAVVLVVAMFTVHLPYGFSSIKLVAVTKAGAQFGPPGYETDLLYIACLAALVLGGPGPLSIDRIIARRARVSQRAEQ